MNYISILIVDDDFNKISIIIKNIKEVINDFLIITQASSVQEAVENLRKKEFHLLITDLQMPLKYDDFPDDRGGESLIKNIYRKKTGANIPMYIVGLTQFKELKESTKWVWKIWHYDSSIDDWQKNLRDLIFHISLVKSRISTIKIETLFVEGSSDKKIIESAINHYYVKEIEKISIESINYGGGASWVERQLFIWAKSLTKNPKGDKYIKAIGLFDNDDAGNKAIGNLKKSIIKGSAESKTFSIIKSSYKYSPLLKAVKEKGITFPTTIEDLISIECWKHADDLGWLEFRDFKKIEIDHFILKIDNGFFNEEFLKEHNFNTNEILLITKSVKTEFKLSFCNFACEYENQSLLNLKYLLEDVFTKLKVKID